MLYSYIINIFVAILTKFVTPDTSQLPMSGLHVYFRKNKKLISVINDTSQSLIALGTIGSNNDRKNVSSKLNESINLETISFSCSSKSKKRNHLPIRGVFRVVNPSTGVTAIFIDSSLKLTLC